MFSNYYHLGNTIELFNLQNKDLCSKWHFEGKYSKLFDPSLKCYEMILSTGNLSKMLIPKINKNSKVKTLSIFQGYVIFQLYLFTSKQFSIEFAISDTTNAKRRLIFSSNNDNLVINQLHCRIPIFELPIGKWINLSIDILSFVSECFKNLTFRSIDYISLSMSGKVRYIFTMRTPLIDNLNQIDSEEKNDYDFDDCGNKLSDNSGNSSFAYGAKDIPEKYKFPDNEFAININMNCNYVLQQITIQNQIKQLNYQQKMMFNSEPILIQDTADASNMDKGLKFRHNVYLKNKKKINKFKKYQDPYQENIFENPFNNNYNDNIEFDNGYKYGLEFENNNEIYENNINNNNYTKSRKLQEGEFIQGNDLHNMKNNNMKSQNQNHNTNRFKKIGNLIISKDKPIFSNYNNDNNFENLKSNLNENNNDFLNIQNNDYRNNRYRLYNSLKISNNNQNNNNNDKNKYNFFNKDEYNKLYSKGKGLTEQINQNLNLNENDNNINENEDKYNYQLSTIKNENENENVNSNNTELVEEEKKNFNELDDYQNDDLLNNNLKGDEDKDNNEEKRPFSPPITNIEDPY